MDADDDALVQRFLDEARERARFRNPDDDAGLALLGAALPWKTLIVLVLLGLCLAP